jgi:hypothetical protein
MWPWLVSLAAWSAFLAWHVTQVRPYLVAVGKEQPMFGGGGFNAVAAMAGPYTFGVGLAIVVYTLWKTRWTPAWWMAGPLLILIPLAGVVLDRNYWGFMVLPTALALIGDMLGERTSPVLDDDVIRVPESETILIHR